MIDNAKFVLMRLSLISYNRQLIITLFFISCVLWQYFSNLMWEQ